MLHFDAWLEADSGALRAFGELPARGVLVAPARFGLADLYTRTSRPEFRIDIPRHEWQRDMDRTRRRIDRILHRTPRPADAPRPAQRDYLAIHG